MQMIDVLKRLAELDSTNPNVAKPAMTQEQSLATVTNIEGETITESINECGGPMGMMGGMPAPRTPASFSINASAESGDEVSSMLRDIMNLAGVKPVADLPAFAEPMGGKEIELEPAHSAEMEPSAGDDMAKAIRMIDKMNGPSEEPGAELGDEPGAELGGELAGSDSDSPVADMADQVRDMTAELTGEGQAEEERMYANSPEEETEKYDYGNKQGASIGQTQSKPFTGLGDNNLKNESVEQVSLQLLKAYADFKKQ